MKSGSNKSDERPVGTIIVSVVAGAILGSLVTYSVTKREPEMKPFNAAPANNQVQQFPLPGQQQQFTPAPQPPGEVPPGKVWSPEHGHWHDLPSASQVPAPNPAAPNRQ